MRVEYLNYCLRREKKEIYVFSSVGSFNYILKKCTIVDYYSKPEDGQCPVVKTNFHMVFK